MRIHHLNCATMCPYSPRLVSGEGPLFGEARLVCHCLLIESNRGLVLVDTGLGRQDLRDPGGRLGAMFELISRPALDEAETAIAQVERLGFSAKDVRHIILTHADLDHAGGLSDFPDAEVHLYTEEHRALTERRTSRERMRYRPVQWSHGARFVPHEVDGERWEGFEAVSALPGVAPDILIVPLVGHTRGHAGVAVRAEGGWLLHAGDAYFFRGQMDPATPNIPPVLGQFQRMVDTDRAKRIENQERLRQLAKMRGGEVSVFCAHDPIELDLELAKASVAAARAMNGR